MAAQQLENLQEKMNWHWRNSMRPTRFGPFDSRAAIPLCILIFRLADWRIWLLMGVNLILFRYLERKGLTFPAALRTLRVNIVGKDRPGWLSVQTKQFQDFG